MRLNLYRYSIQRPSQVPLDFPENTVKSKEDLVWEVLTSDLDIGHYASLLGYVAKTRAKPYIFAQLGKKSSVYRVGSPDESFKKETLESWLVCNIIINTSTDPVSGQSIAFEFKNSVFTNTDIQIGLLQDEFNKKLHTYGYEMQITPVTHEQDFWDLVLAHKGAIEELSLTLQAPNFLNLQNTLSDDLREARDTYDMTSAEIILRNPDGNLKVPSDDPLINQGVEYIAKGAGVYKIRVRHQKRPFVSGQKVKTKEVEVTEVELESSDAAIFKDIVRNIFTKLND